MIYTIREDFSLGSYQTVSGIPSDSPEEVRSLLKGFNHLDGITTQYLAGQSYGAVVISRRIPGSRDQRGGIVKYAFVFPQQEAWLLLAQPMAIFHLADYAQQEGPALPKTLPKWPDSVLTHSAQNVAWTPAMSDAYAALLCRVAMQKKVCFVTSQLGREALCRVLQELPTDQRVQLSFAYGCPSSGSRSDLMTLAAQAEGGPSFDIPPSVTELKDRWLMDTEKVCCLFGLDPASLSETLPTDPVALKEALLPPHVAKEGPERKQKGRRGQKKGESSLIRILQTTAPYIRAMILLACAAVFLAVGNTCYHVGSGIFITVRLNANDLLRLGAVFLSGLCLGGARGERGKKP